MLCVTVKLNHAVRVGDVEFRVIGIRGRQVEVGIDAPPDVPIVRDNAKRTTKREDVK